MYQKIQEIIMEEFQSAERRILRRIYEEVEGVTQGNRTNSMYQLQRQNAEADVEKAEKRVQSAESVQSAQEESTKKSLPTNPSYEKALNLYQKGSTHSFVARQLDVSIATAKNYYNNLVIRGYLEVEDEEWSPKERKVVECIFERKMTLSETAEELGRCTISNVTNLRNSALRKNRKLREKYREMRTDWD